MANRHGNQRSTSGRNTSLKPGDRVEWDSSGGKAVGRVEKKLTRKTRVKGHVAKASKEKPEYLVRSEKSDKAAAHRPQELRKR